MTEYWVSKSKYYCKVCKIWMADDKVSRQMHDTSVRHRETLQRQKHKKEEAQYKDARSQAELKKQLHEINRAAYDAVKNDREDCNHTAMFGFVCYI